MFKFKNSKFFKNIRFLLKNDLSTLKKKDTISLDQLNTILDNFLLYEIPANTSAIKKPKIKNFQETIDYLTNNRVSFTRFGDGELALINNQGIPFQKADPVLANKLREVLKSQEENLLIGINYHYYYSDFQNLLETVKKFYRLSVPHSRKILDRHLLSDKQYYSAAVTQAYLFFENYDFHNHFENMKKIWEGRDITIIAGETVFDGIENNIFNCARSVEYINAPSMHAFDAYHDILKQAASIDKNRLIILILGPTAKPLTYDLFKLGYQTLDLGHIAKDYDAYMKEHVRNDKYIIDFFSPD